MELEETAPAFQRRLDAPLVGRKRELAALRRSLKRAVDGSTARVALVTAPPGVGKSRLAAEFTRRAKGITILSGRCLSYGDGITYWPLREALRDAPGSEERDASSRHSTRRRRRRRPRSPGSSAASARRVRASGTVHGRLRRRPLGGADVPRARRAPRRQGRRGKSLSSASRARSSSKTVRHSSKDAQTPTACCSTRCRRTRRTLYFAGLGGTILESDQRARVVEAAEGNPLFLEQLLALALEGGLTEQRAAGDDSGAARCAPRPARARRAGGARAWRDSREGVHCRRRRRAA